MGFIDRRREVGCDLGTKESGQAAPEGIVLAFNSSGGEEGVKEIFDNHGISIDRFEPAHQDYPEAVPDGLVRRSVKAQRVIERHGHSFTH